METKVTIKYVVLDEIYNFAVNDFLFEIVYSVKYAPSDLAYNGFT